MMENQYTKDFFHTLREYYRTKNIIKISESCNKIIKDLKSNDLMIHPLGFYYNNLFEFENNEKFRIHIWSNNSERLKPLMDIHNHYYNVISYVVTGHIFNTLYSSSKSIPSTHSLYSGSYDKDGKRILKKTGQNFNLKKIVQNKIKAGNLYIIDKAEIHKGEVPSSEFTITIVYTEKPTNPNPQVFGKINKEDEYTFPKLMIDKNEVKYILRKCQCLIE